MEDNGAEIFGKGVLISQDSPRASLSHSTMLGGRWTCGPRRLGMNFKHQEVEQIFSGNNISAAPRIYIYGIAFKCCAQQAIQSYHATSSSSHLNMSFNLSCLIVAFRQ